MVKNSSFFLLLEFPTEPGEVHFSPNFSLSPGLLCFFNVYLVLTQVYDPGMS